MPRNSQVDAWLARYKNPMKPVVERMREIILSADDRVDECIKWRAPTFTYKGNIASFFPKSKGHASLMFHRGKAIPGRHPRLEGGGGTSRVLKIESVFEANLAKREIEQIVQAWCALRDREAPDKAAARRAPASADVLVVKRRGGQAEAVLRRPPVSDDVVQPSVEVATSEISPRKAPSKGVPKKATAKKATAKKATAKKASAKKATAKKAVAKKAVAKKAVAKKASAKKAVAKKAVAKKAVAKKASAKKASAKKAVAKKRASKRR